MEKKRYEKKKADPVNVMYGNLLDLAEQGQFDVIIHGCNCQHTMGAGIAYQMATRYPQTYEADRLTQYGNIDKLGAYSYAYVQGKDNHIFLVINAYTQLKPGADFRLSALREAFTRIKKVYSGKRIGYPKIGAGIGGGNWNKIARVIDEIFEGEDHTLVIYDKDETHKQL